MMLKLRTEQFNKKKGKKNSKQLIELEICSTQQFKFSLHIFESFSNKLITVLEFVEILQPAYGEFDFIASPFKYNGRDGTHDRYAMTIRKDCEIARFLGEILLLYFFFLLQICICSKSQALTFVWHCLHEHNQHNKH